MYRRGSAQYGIRHVAARFMRRTGIAARRVRLVAMVMTASGALAVPADHAHAQSDLAMRAMEYEDARNFSEAARAYRALLQQALAARTPDGDGVALALLGLERVWYDASMRDSIMPVVHDVLRVRPTDPVARSIQFRTLAAASNDGDLAAAFDDWRLRSRDDPAPWREYVRTLLAMGRQRAADSVLVDAQRALGTRTEFAGEAGQTAALLGRWYDAARAWRVAVDATPWSVSAAAYSLQRTPEPARDSVRGVLRSPPVTLAARQLLAEVETGWGDVQRGWEALRALPLDDSTAVRWREHAERAEMSGAWSVALRVWDTLVVHSSGSRGARGTGGASDQLRAASAALRSGDAAGALARVQAVQVQETTSVPGDVAAIRSDALRVEVRALVALGRVADAETRVERFREYSRALAQSASSGSVSRDSMGSTTSGADALLVEELAQLLVSGWVKVGDVARARAAATSAGLELDYAVSGWLALFDGDLAEARRQLVRVTGRDVGDTDALADALAILARTRMPRSEALGEAFLARARGDSARAAAQFAAVAAELSDAAPALLAMAARLEARRGAAARAQPLWARIVVEYGSSPEAPEALLEQARALVRSGKPSDAMAVYETLLTQHPGSALVPQARNEWERLQQRIPPTFESAS